MQIIELKRQVQPSTPLEVTEQCRGIIKYGREMITRAMNEGADFLDQLLITLTSLQENLTSQLLETEAREL